MLPAKWGPFSFDLNMLRYNINAQEIHVIYSNPSIWTTANTQLFWCNYFSHFGNNCATSVFLDIVGKPLRAVFHNSCTMGCCPHMPYILAYDGAIVDLTHWGQDKMAAIFQTTFSNAFSWMKMYKFWLRFHWSLFPRVPLTIFQHWFR